MIIDAKAVEVRDAYIGAIILHPRAISHLRAQLFINSAWVSGFSELIGLAYVLKSFAIVPCMIFSCCSLLKSQVT